MAKPGKTSVFSQFRSAPVDEAEAFLEGNVDYAVLALGILILVGWLPSDGKPKATHVRVPGATPETFQATYVRYAREDVTLQFDKAGRRPPFKAGFVCSMRVADQTQNAIRQCINGGAHIEIGTELELGVERRFSVVPIRVSEAMQNGVMTRVRLQMALQSLLVDQPNDPDITVQLLKSLDASKRIHAHIDVAQTTNRRRMLLTGWVESADQGRLVLVGGDLTGPPQLLDPVITPREDVSAHLRTLHLNPATNLHGFVAVAAIGDRKEYRLCRVSDSEALWSDELEIEPRVESTHGMIGKLRSHVSESVGRDADSFHKLAKSALGQDLPPPPAVAQVKRFSPLEDAGRPIRTSIIVPFYGDAFYVLDHLTAQARAPSDVEWIFVCDDPRLSASMLDAISNRKNLIRQPTQLVLLSANGGFAHANNIGARYARGDYLLLMNSDVYCKNFDFVAPAILTLESRSNVGCVGFSLQFEDGTVQHEGMTFELSRWLDGLWTCEHHNKGMPQDWNEIAVKDVEAVTAALLLLRRSDFEGQHIFDPVYLVGDFEDADLCLRIRDQGKAIALVVAPGIYHLERQSLRYTGNDEARMAITHLNCLTFNDRWGSKISAALQRS